jgi:hypothetical protein
MAAKVRGEDTPSKPESLGEEEEGEGEVTPSPIYLPRKTLTLLDDIISQQVGIVVGVHQPKRTRIEIGSSVGLP